MKKVLIVLVVLVMLLAVGAVGGYLYYRVQSDGTGSGGKTVKVTVEQGESPASIAQKLEDAGVVSHALFFRLYLRETHTASTLQYGTFSLTTGDSYGNIVKVLQTVQKRTDVVNVTLVDGNTLIQYANAVEKAGLCTAEEFIKEANTGDFSDIPFWSKIDTDPDTFMKAEGYLFPETYQFYADDDVHTIVHKIFEQFDSEITDAMYARMKELGLSLRETITLASLIEEEAGNPANMAGVSGVFHNRLAAGSPYPKMGSDVTWYYIEDFIRPYYGGADQVPAGMENAYYTGDDDPDSRVGLPAGPLSNPSLAAINAALYPEKSDYYFFLTDLSGKYYYAKTYEEHLANIAAMKAANAEIKASIG